MSESRTMETEYRDFDVLIECLKEKFGDCIQISQKGNLSLKEYHGTYTGEVYAKIEKGKMPTYTYGDMGVIKKADGTWGIRVGDDAKFKDWGKWLLGDDGLKQRYAEKKTDTYIDRLKMQGYTFAKKVEGKTIKYQGVKY